MRDRLTELGDSTVVVMITFTDPDNIAEYQRANSLPFPILLDPKRDTYRAYGLDRGSLRRVWGWRTAKSYIEILRRDGRGGLKRPTEDTFQLGGDFIIGADGDLAWGFWSEGPDDRPSVDDLIAEIRRIGS